MNKIYPYHKFLPTKLIFRFLNCVNYSNFVPNHDSCTKASLELLQRFFDKYKRIVVLTGAGISTESGIPDYRSEDVGLYATSTKRPVKFQDFLKHSNIRKLYWARNFVGWSKFSSFTPNASHSILSNWEIEGKVQCVVTQNVDRLHIKAGSQNVIELHGSAYEVECLNCSYTVSRDQFQDDLLIHNKSISLKSRTLRPDGDVDLTNEEVDGFEVPYCPNCAGILKPRIVFFGDSVPKESIERTKSEIMSSDALLTMGTSLAVYSAYRFILFAKDLKVPIAIINIGSTRGDKHCLFRVPARCGEVLPLIKLS